jgi:tetratricopeptide (TPR) repeat protein
LRYNFRRLKLNIFTRRSYDRIHTRLPDKENNRPKSNKTKIRTRPGQKEFPKENNKIPLPLKEDINPQMPGPVDEKYTEHYDTEIIIFEEIYYELRKFPDPVEINYKSEGIQKYKDGDYISALEDLSIAIEEDSNDNELYYYRGLVELKIQLFEEALNDFNKYIKYFFFEPEGYFQRGLAKFYLDEKMEAKRDFEIAADMDHKIAISILKRFY